MNAAAPAVLLALCLLALPGAAAGPPVVVAPVRNAPFPLTVEALGTARASESIEIRPRITETITAIHFTEGERVEQGFVLVELEDREARADVAEARAALVETVSQAERAQQLFETRALAESELDRRLALRDADRARLAAAEARLAQTRIRAPFAGRLGLRNVSLGALVTPETVITTLDATDTIKLDFDVPETALAHLREGQSFTARSAAWPDARFAGRVASVDTRIDPVSRTVIVRGVLPNPEERLRPGMFLSVTLVRDDVSALVVPEEAIVPEQARQFALVVGEGDVIEKREVVTGRRRPGEVEIVSGLRAGERVVVEGSQRARPGEPVEVVAPVDAAGAAP